MFELSFKYPPAVFRESDLILANDWPLWLLYAGIALAFLLLLGSLLLRRTTLKLWQLLIVGGLQTAMAALVLLVLWQPALVSERLVKGENSVAILLDTSASMAQAENGSTRMAQAQPLLSESGLSDIAETYTILPFTFAADAESLDSFETLPAPGDTTDIGPAVLDSLRQSSGASLGAVIVISDGADNRGAIAQSTMSEILDFQVPVHTVGIGRESIAEDLELTELSLPQHALPGTTLSARVSIRHDTPPGESRTARLKVYDGEDFLTSQDITLSSNDLSTLAYVDIDAEEPGQLDLRFSLDPIDNETHLANNTRSQVVDVRESRYRILYIEGEPRWEYKFMRRALSEDPSIQLTTLLRVTPNKFYRQGIDDASELEQGFPTERAELFGYDSLMIGSVEVAEFSDEQLDMIRDFVSERGGSLMMLAGRSGLAEGGWGESPINAILPSRLNSGDSDFVREQVEISLTESGRSSPMLQLSDSRNENNRLWSGLPAIADYQLMGPLRPAASTLLEFTVEGRKHPLLVSQPYGRGQSVILATGGTWRWQMGLPVEDMRHETFWRQLARGLVANSPRPFELSSRVEGDSISIRAEVRDPEAEENQGLAVSAVVSTPDDQVLDMELLPVAGKPGTWESSFDPASNGLFSIEAISRVDDEPVNSNRTAIRYEQDGEAFNIRQNRPLLERLANASGGQYWTPAQWDELADAIAYSDAGITEQDLRYLWDAPFFFLLLFLLKAAEWLLRRRWSTI